MRRSVNLPKGAALENLQIRPYVKVSIESRLLGTKPRKIGKSFTTLICKENKMLKEALENSSWVSDSTPLGAVIDLGEFNKNLEAIIPDTIENLKHHMFGGDKKPL